MPYDSKEKKKESNRRYRESANGRKRRLGDDPDLLVKAIQYLRRS